MGCSTGEESLPILGAAPVRDSRGGEWFLIRDPVQLALTPDVIFASSIEEAVIQLTAREADPALVQWYAYLRYRGQIVRLEQLQVAPGADPIVAAKAHPGQPIRMPRGENVSPPEGATSAATSAFDSALSWEKDGVYFMGSHQCVSRILYDPGRADEFRATVAQLLRLQRRREQKRSRCEVSKVTAFVNLTRQKAVFLYDLSRIYFRVVASRVTIHSVDAPRLGRISKVGVETLLTEAESFTRAALQITTATPVKRSEAWDQSVQAHRERLEGALQPLLNNWAKVKDQPHADKIEVMARLLGLLAN